MRGAFTMSWLYNQGMEKARAKRSSIIVAAILAILTLSVFAFSRQSGPESAIRAYHESLMRQDTDGSLNLMAVGDREASLRLVSLGRQLVANCRGATASQVITEGRNGKVQVVYECGASGMYIIPFALNNDSVRWRILPSETLNNISRVAPVPTR